MSLTFSKIIPTANQINDLYLLLMKRKKSISHQILPNRKDHDKFVIENPYLAWYLIKREGELFGSVYLQSDNSIGINLLQSTIQDVYEIITFIKENHNPLPPIKSLRRGEFYMNVASNNDELINILKELGIDEIQRSFLL